VSDVGVEQPVRQEAPPPHKAERSLRWLNTLRDAFLQRREASVLLVALGLLVYFRASSDVFLTHDNLVNIAQAAAPGAIVAVGIVLLLVSGEIDLSVGMVFALAPFLMHYAVDFYGVPVIPAILLSLLCAAVIGGDQRALVLAEFDLERQVLHRILTRNTALRHREFDDCITITGADEQMRAVFRDRVHLVAGRLQHARSGPGVAAFEDAVEGVDQQHAGLAA